MLTRRSRRALVGAASLLAAVSLGGVAATTADAAAAGHIIPSATHVIQTRRGDLGPALPVSSSYGDPSAVTPAALADQASFRYAIHIEAAGAPAKDLIDSFSSTFSDYPDFIPNTSSASFAANQKDNKPFVMDITGAYVRPGRLKQVFKVGDNTVSQWFIGRKATLQYNKEKAVNVNIPDGSDPLDSFGPVIIWDNGFTSWFNQYSTDDVLSCTPQDDTVNDMSVSSCDFNVTDQDQVKDLMSIFAGGIDKVTDGGAELYLSDDSATKDVPIRFAVEFKGKDDKNKAASLTVTMDITDLNKKSVTVDAGK